MAIEYLSQSKSLTSILIQIFACTVPESIVSFAENPHADGDLNLRQKLK